MQKLRGVGGIQHCFNPPPRDSASHESIRTATLLFNRNMRGQPLSSHKIGPSIFPHGSPFP